MDKLEDKIKISQNAVKQLAAESKDNEKDTNDNSIKGNVKTLAITKNVNTKARSAMMLRDRANDDGCKFSKQPSGLSSDVKVRTQNVIVKIVQYTCNSSSVVSNKNYSNCTTFFIIVVIYNCLLLLLLLLYIICLLLIFIIVFVYYYCLHTVPSTLIYPSWILF